MKDISRLFQRRTKRNKFPNVLGKINDYTTVHMYSPINRAIAQTINHANGGLYYFKSKYLYVMPKNFYSSALKSLYDYM